MDPSFSNLPVDMDALPHVEDVPFRPVSSRYPVYRLVSHGIVWALVIPALMIAALLGFEFIIIYTASPLVLLVPAALVAWMSYLEARRRAWALRDHDLLYRSGLIFHKTLILPLSRVQHVESSSGPIERAFDLMRVTCFTAGGQQADLVVKGLRSEDAERVRLYLLRQIQRDDEDDAGDE